MLSVVLTNGVLIKPGKNSIIVLSTWKESEACANKTMFSFEVVGELFGDA